MSLVEDFRSEHEVIDYSEKDTYCRPIEHPTRLIYLSILRIGLPLSLKICSDYAQYSLSDRSTREVQNATLVLPEDSRSTDLQNWSKL